MDLCVGQDLTKFAKTLILEFLKIYIYIYIYRNGYFENFDWI